VWAQRIRPIEDRVRRHGEWYRATWPVLPALCVTADRGRSPEQRHRAQATLVRFAQVEVAEFLRELDLNATTVDRYCPPLLYAAYCGMIWAGERIAGTTPVPYPVDAFDNLVSEIHRTMERVWQRIGPRAIRSLLPAEVKNTMVVALPEQHRKEILSELALARLDEFDRMLVQEVAPFVQRVERVGMSKVEVPSEAWSKVAAILTLKDVRGRTLTPGNLKKRYQRIQKQMEKEHDWLDEMTKQAMDWPTS
jgi:hypothetical protein